MNGLTEPTYLYRVFGEAGVLLYIGITDDFGRRWKQHARMQPWWPERRSFAIDLYDSREEAKAAEEAAIKVERPKHNFVHASPEIRKARSKAPAVRPSAIPPRRRGVYMSPQELDRREPLAMLGGFLRENYLPVPDLDSPGSDKWAAAIYVDFTLAYSRGWHRLRRMLAEVREAERRAGSPEAVASCRRARLHLYELGGLPCPSCVGEPPDGMECITCGTTGQAKHADHGALARAS